MGIIKDLADKYEPLEVAKETARLNLEGLEYNAALRKAKDIYTGKDTYIEKSHCSTDQSKSNDNTNKFNSSIAPNENIDNGQVYNVNTGETIRDL